MVRFITTFAIGMMITSPYQNALTEGQAVAYLQQVPVRQFDRSLPATPLGVWIRQTAGDQAGISWVLTDCGNSASGKAEGDIPGCVEVNAMLPNYRKLAIVIRVGTYGRGIEGKPLVQFAVIEDKGRLYAVQALSDLPEMLRMRVIRPGWTPVRLPALPNLRVPMWPGRRQDYMRLLPAGSYQPPHISAPAPAKVSEGVLMGSAISRVVPEYPVLARQNRITGVVLVRVTIAEDGRVVEAIAAGGPPVLQKPAEDAARKWIFKPTILNGIPVRVQGDLTFVFSQP